MSVRPGQKELTLVAREAPDGVHTVDYVGEDGATRAVAAEPPR
jgi:hypothetical protein